MMYIRTKDGVYKVSHYNDWATHKRKGATLIDGDKTSYIKNENIIAQSETIEELCDEFIDIIPRENGKAYHDHWEWSVEEKRFNNDIGESVPFDYFSDDTYFRGAIWTDKGLIYVAKMNDKGELCLL